MENVDKKGESEESKPSQNPETQNKVNVQESQKTEEPAGDLKIKDSKGVEEYLQSAGTALKSACEGWVPLFGESVHYENYFSERLNEMIQQVLNKEEHLKQEKKKLVDRLNVVRKSLQIPII